MSAVEFEDHPTDPDKVILRKKPRIDQGPDYERGFIDGMQYQMQSSVDRAVNSMSQGPRVWTPLPEHIKDALNQWHSKYNIMSYVEHWLKEKNT